MTVSGRKADDGFLGSPALFRYTGLYTVPLRYLSAARRPLPSQPATSWRASLRDDKGNPTGAIIAHSTAEDLCLMQVRACEGTGLICRAALCIRTKERFDGGIRLRNCILSIVCADVP
jgi:hypothetical protein